MLIKPIMLFRPYKVVCGPRSTSICLMSYKSNMKAFLSKIGTPSTYKPTGGVPDTVPIPRIQSGVDNFKPPSCMQKFGTIPDKLRRSGLFSFNKFFPLITLRATGISLMDNSLFSAVMITYFSCLIALNVESFVCTVSDRWANKCPEIHVNSKMLYIIRI